MVAITLTGLVRSHVPDFAEITEAIAIETTSLESEPLVLLSPLSLLALWMSCGWGGGTHLAYCGD